MLHQSVKALALFSLLASATQSTSALTLIMPGVPATQVNLIVAQIITSEYGSPSGGSFTSTGWIYVASGSYNVGANCTIAPDAVALMIAEKRANNGTIQGRLIVDTSSYNPTCDYYQ